MLTRVTTDTDALTEMLTSGLVTLIGDVVTLSLILVVMVRMSIPLTLIVMAALPLVVLVALKFRRDVAFSNRRIRTAVARINSYFAGAPDGDERGATVQPRRAEAGRN